MAGSSHCSDGRGGLSELQPALKSLDLPLDLTAKAGGVLACGAGLCLIPKVCAIPSCFNFETLATCLVMQR